MGILGYIADGVAIRQGVLKSHRLRRVIRYGALCTALRGSVTPLLLFLDWILILKKYHMTTTFSSSFIGKSTARECDFLWNWITFIGNKRFKYRCLNIDRPPAKFHFGVRGIGRENRKSPDNIHRVGNKCPSVEVAGRISSPAAKAINKQISLLLACAVCWENKL